MFFLENRAIISCVCSQAFYFYESNMYVPAIASIYNIPEHLLLKNEMVSHFALYPKHNA